MKRREFLRILGGAAALALVPAAALASPTPLMFDVRGAWTDTLTRIAQAVVGGTEDNWHFQIRWKRTVKHLRAQGIYIDYGWSIRPSSDIIDDLQWRFHDGAWHGISLPGARAHQRLLNGDFND